MHGPKLNAVKTSKPTAMARTAPATVDAQAPPSEELAASLAAALAAAEVVYSASKLERQYTQGVRKMLNWVQQHEVAATMSVVDIAFVIDSAALIADAVWAADPMGDVNVFMKASVDVIMRYKAQGGLDTVHPLTVLHDVTDLLLTQQH